MNRIIAHIDLNSFFASVEQQANPLLRGKALGVCAYLHKRGCVIAASIEAKRLGMKVGQRVEDASRTVPGAIFVQNDPPKYRTVGERVFQLLSGLTDTMERYSIDEAFFDLTGWYRDMDAAARAINVMKRRIQNEVGEWLTCSAGIAATRFLAKTGSDYKKPNGLTIITPSNLDDILSRLDLEAVCGIGPRTRRKLEALGYASLLQIKRAPVVNLMQSFGKRGYFLWCNLNGMEVEGVAGEAAPPKSIGHSYCVPAAANRENKISGILAKLTDRAARRLRREGFLAGALSVVVGFRGPGYASPQGPFWQPRDGQGGSSWVRFPEPVDDAFTLMETSNRLLHGAWAGQSVNFLAVTLLELSKPVPQIRLFHGPRDFRKRDLTAAMDRVRDRYGDASLLLGRSFGIGQDDAPERIGFRKL